MTCAEVLERAREASVLVVGDICLDRWCRYEPTLAEASRETGIPRCAVTSTAVTPGAGGTVAANLASLGAGRISVLGAIGQDGFGYELRRALAARGIESDLLVESAAIQTFTYTKLINAVSGDEDLPRVDFVNAERLSADSEERLVARFVESKGEFDAVVVADQAETDQGGVVTGRVRDAISEEAGLGTGRVFVADSRRRVQHFRNVIATPNEAEADEACRREFGESDYGRLRRRIAGPALIVTAGRRGAWMVDGSGTRLIEAAPIGEVVDTCGAGDSLSAGLALALAVGAGLEEALRFGIIVAGITVGQPGTGAAGPAEMLAAAESIADRR